MNIVRATLVLLIVLANFRVDGAPKLVFAQSQPFRCPGALFQFPLIDGNVGWLYADHRSIGTDPSGDHTGIDIYPPTLDEQADVYPLADGILKEVNRSRRSFEVYYPESGVTSYMAHVELKTDLGNDDLVWAHEPLGTLQFQRGNTHLHFSLKHTGGWSHYNDQLALNRPGSADDPSGWLNAHLNDPEGRATPLFSRYPYYRTPYEHFCRVPPPPDPARVELLARLYGLIFGREPDADGLDFYLRSGLDEEAVRASLTMSDECRIQQPTFFCINRWAGERENLQIDLDRRRAIDQARQSLAASVSNSGLTECPREAAYPGIELEFVVEGSRKTTVILVCDPSMHSTVVAFEAEFYSATYLVASQGLSDYLDRHFGDRRGFYYLQGGQWHAYCPGFGYTTEDECRRVNPSIINRIS